ncbi:tetratricopeptide repeat protein [Aquimarina sp. 2-A2]|uniref:tetratricopeptide repeat protein n=1 Tax=Aquimarina sp. 2-A2 TaxID=3382644 RepID=UPI00387F0743
MKNIVGLFIFLMSIGVCAQQTESFDRGNALYTAKKYEEAIKNYLTVIEEGYESEELYFNLANAYYKQNEIGPSIYYYEKALSLNPTNQDIKNNLTFARNATVDVIDEIPQGFLSKIFNRTVSLFSLQTWAWSSVLLMLSFVLLFIGYQRASDTRKKRWLFVGSWFSFGLCVVIFFLAQQQQSLKANNQYAIIFAKESAVLSEPNLGSEELFELHEGTKVKVISTVNSWKNIRLTDGKSGWMFSKNLKEL